MITIFNIVVLKSYKTSLNKLTSFKYNIYINTQNKNLACELAFFIFVTDPELIL